MLDPTPTYDPTVDPRDALIVLGQQWTNIISEQPFPEADHDILSNALNVYLTKHKGADHEWATLCRDLMKRPTAQRLPLVAAELVEHLGGNESEDFAAWVKETWAGLSTDRSDLVEIIVRCRIPLATFTHDDLFESMSGFTTRYLDIDTRDVGPYSSSNHHSVLHLRGCWRRPESITFDYNSLLSHLLDMGEQAPKTLILVGVDSELTRVISDVGGRLTHPPVIATMPSEAGSPSPGRNSAPQPGPTAAQVGRWLTQLFPRTCDGETPVKVTRLPTDEITSGFVGRSDVLDTVRSHLSNRQWNRNIVVLRGEMGVGKSRLAREFGYAENLRNRYDIIWWVSSESPAVARQEFAALAEPLGLPAVDDLERLCDAVRHHLGAVGRWLVIFDNVENIDRIRQLFPSDGFGDVILTVRTWVKLPEDLVLEIVDIEPLSVEDAVKLLNRPELPPSDLTDLVQRVRTMPIALLWAREALSNGDSPEELMSELHSRVERFIYGDSNWSPELFTQWQAAASRLEQRDQPAFQILRLCAFLGPEAIPEWLLEHEVVSELLGGTIEPAELRAAFRSMSEAGLADLHLNGVAVHRVTGAYLRGSLPTEERYRHEQAAELLLLDAFPALTNDETAWETSRSLLKIVIAAASTTLQPNSLSMAKVTLLTRAGNLLFRQAAYQECVDVYQQARTMASALGADASVLAMVESNLGLALVRAGQIVEGTRVLLSTERIKDDLPTDDARLIAIMNNIGCGLRESGNLDRAATYMDEARRLQRRHSVSDPWTVGIVLNNLGVVQAQRRKAGADELLKTAMSNLRRVAGRRQEALATSLNNLGIVLRSRRDFTGSERVLREGLELAFQLWPDHHPDVAGILNNLGVTLRAQGRLAESLSTLERALEIERGFLGQRHPEVALTLQNLGVTQRHLKRYVSALRTQTLALEISREAQGAESRGVAAGHGSIGNLLRRLGALEEAVENHRTALRIERSHYDANDLELAGTLDNLGRALRHSGQLEEAANTFRQALAIKAAQDKPDAVDLAKSEDNLGVCYRYLRDYDSSVQLHEQALVHRRTGKQDPEGLYYCLVNLMIAYRLVGRSADADRLMLEATEMESLR